MSAHRSLSDQTDSFGWISIALHWMTASIVIAMWLIGQTIAEQVSIDTVAARRQLHVTLGLASWALLAGRILWRAVTPHPRVAGQSARLHRIARSIHFLMLVLISIMLVTGPVMAWLGAESGELFHALKRIHGIIANVLLLLVVLHILAAIKHLMFHEDETFVRMLLPKR